MSVNSDNSSLFILLVSNNFVELKSAVFKRFDANNLFQIACSDVVERFQLVLFLLLITVMNVSHLGVEVAWEAGWLQKAAVMSVMVLGGEMVVDWIKHGFICKFNMISPRVYRQYAEIIQHDFVQAHFAHSVTAHAASSASSNSLSSSNSTGSTSGSSSRNSSAHSVSRRLGLSSLPLAVLVLRVVGSTFQHSRGSSPILAVWWLPFELTVELLLKVAVIVLLFALLTAIKLLISISLLGRIAQQALRDKKQQTSSIEKEVAKRDSSNQQTLPVSGSDLEERKEERLDKDGSDDKAALSQLKSEVEHDDNRDGVKRIVMKRDGLTINTQLALPTRITFMPPLESGPSEAVQMSSTTTTFVENAPQPPLHCDSNCDRALPGVPAMITVTGVGG